MTQEIATEAPDLGSEDDAVLAALAGEIAALRRSLVRAETQWGALIDRVHPDNRASAVNLVHYWAIRQHDLRELQQRLAAYGLSSLGRCEPHVQATLEAISTALEALSGRGSAPRRPVVGFEDGPRLLQARANQLFGPAPHGRQSRIMVTLPSEAAGLPALPRELISSGMNVARINCAHDGPAAWTAMIANLRAAVAETGRPCRVAMDLAGPKLRTGPLVDGPQVIKLRPRRDALGAVVRPAYCWLRADDTPAPDDTAVLPVSAGWLAGLSLGDAITLHDARGQSRLLVVRQVEDGAVRVSTDHTAYLTTGTMLRSGNGEHSRIGRLPALEQYLTLHVGDTLVLTRDCTPAPVQDAGPARIGCTLEAVFGHVLPGQLVHLDDAKISGTVLAAGDDEVTVRITRAAAGGSKLRAAKGINLPETVLPVSALTDTDRTNLEFVSAHGDLVELSFVRSPGDVEDLLAALAELDDQRLGIVLKIETAQAFEDLPAILLTAMRRAHTGVMIARGDLASECGYEELAELQEEILWLCEAAHLPVIWATQVLDQMARSGQPSRAEITDAAMGTRAECVMLNKGPHIVETVASLDDILVRMTSHHNKKNSLMRALRFWHATG